MAQQANWRDRVQTMRNNFIEAKPRICLERLRKMTEVYRDNPCLPPILLKAKTLEKVLTEMPIEITDLELIVGNMTTKGPRGGLITPEFTMAWVDEIDELDTRPLDKLYLTDEEKEEIRSIVPFWQDKMQSDKLKVILPPEIADVNFKLFQHPVTIDNGRGHTAVQMDKVLEIGLAGIKAEVEDAMEKNSIQNGASADSYYFYQAAIICLDAVMAFAARYAELARKMAAEDGVSEERKAELLKIAENCEQVPAGPAHTFYEALQAVWFVIIAEMIEEPAYGYIPGRMDQFLYDFYKSDLENGVMTREEMLEVAEHWFVKINEPQIILRTAAAKIFTGQPLAHNLTLGGLKKDGTDATNELSYLFIDSEMDVQLIQPDLMFRIHENTPKEFLLRACEVARERVGKAKFLMDDTAIQCLLNDGKEIEDARDYVLVGCMQPFVPGKHNIIMDGTTNMVKCLELALNNGVDPVSGQKMGPETGDPTTFETYEDLWNAFCAQLANAANLFTKYSGICLNLAEKNVPVPFQSVLTEGCIEKGNDLFTCGTKYNNRGSMCAGPVTAGDSLAVMKKLIYDDKTVTMEEMLAALKADFEGYDDLLAKIDAVPKFGNGNEYVDNIVRDVVNQDCAEYGSYYDWKGAHYIVALQAVTGNISYGAACGATPDGRHAHRPLNDGISPTQGKNTSGIAASMKSVCTVDLANAIQGSVFNLTVSPDYVNTPEKLEKFAALIQSYRAMGGFLVQFNIVDTDTLRDAQLHPEKYRELTVRVSTYSSFFVELSKDVQDDIITRLEMTN